MENNEYKKELKKLLRKHWYLKKKQDPVWWAKKQAANRKGYLAKIEKQAKLLAMKPASIIDAFKLQNMTPIEPVFKPQSFIDTPHLPVQKSLLAGFDIYERDRRSPLKDSHLNINSYGRCIINKGAIDKYGLRIYNTCNFYVKDSDTVGLLFSVGNGRLHITWHNKPNFYSYFQVGRHFLKDKKVIGRFQIVDTKHFPNDETLEVLLKRTEVKQNGNN